MNCLESQRSNHKKVVYRGVTITQSADPNWRMFAVSLPGERTHWYSNIASAKKAVRVVVDEKGRKI